MCESMSVRVVRVHVSGCACDSISLCVVCACTCHMLVPGRTETLSLYDCYTYANTNKSADPGACAREPACEAQLGVQCLVLMFSA